jgi:hypothetical protein
MSKELKTFLSNELVGRPDVGKESQLRGLQDYLVLSFKTEAKFTINLINWLNVSNGQSKAMKCSFAKIAKESSCDDDQLKRIKDFLSTNRDPGKNRSDDIFDDYDHNAAKKTAEYVRIKNEEDKQETPPKLLRFNTMSAERQDQAPISVEALVSFGDAVSVINDKSSVVLDGFFNDTFSINAAKQRFVSEKCGLDESTEPGSVLYQDCIQSVEFAVYIKENLKKTLNNLSKRQKKDLIDTMVYSPIVMYVTNKGAQRSRGLDDAELYGKDSKTLSDAEKMEYLSVMMTNFALETNLDTTKKLDQDGSGSIDRLEWKTFLANQGEELINKGCQDLTGQLTTLCAIGEDTPEELIKRIDPYLLLPKLEHMEDGKGLRMLNEIYCSKETVDIDLANIDYHSQAYKDRYSPVGNLIRASRHSEYYRQGDQKLVSDYLNKSSMGAAIASAALTANGGGSPSSPVTLSYSGGSGGSSGTLTVSGSAGTSSVANIAAAPQSISQAAAPSLAAVPPVMARSVSSPPPPIGGGLILSTTNNSSVSQERSGGSGSDLQTPVNAGYTVRPYAPQIPPESAGGSREEPAKLPSSYSSSSSSSSRVEPSTVYIPKADVPYTAPVARVRGVRGSVTETFNKEEPPEYMPSNNSDPAAEEHQRRMNEDYRAEVKASDPLADYRSAVQTNLQRPVPTSRELDSIDEGGTGAKIVTPSDLLETNSDLEHEKFQLTKRCLRDESSKACSGTVDYHVKKITEEEIKKLIEEKSLVDYLGNPNGPSDVFSFESLKNKGTFLKGKKQIASYQITISVSPITRLQEIHRIHVSQWQDEAAPGRVGFTLIDSVNNVTSSEMVHFYLDDAIKRTGETQLLRIFAKELGIDLNELQRGQPKKKQVRVDGGEQASEEDKAEDRAATTKKMETLFGNLFDDNDDVKQ